MKTKKFLMTSLLVMGMIIAKAANGFPPELVLVSQPVLTYNSNSVTIYYDIQNIGDYAYRGDLYIYLDPDNGYCYGRKHMKICAGSIRRVAVSIPAYRANPSWTYTVMPYYELDDELYSFTTFEYFEPVRFCWYGYHNEPWVVINVGPRPRHYHRPGDYRYYYDGYRPMMPPPGGGGPGGPHGMPPMDPHHHTYGYHHSNGGYPANYHPSTPTPGYNPGENVKPNGGDNSSGGNGGAAVVKPNGSGSGNLNNNGGATTRPSTGNSSGTVSNGGATTRPSTGNSNGTVSNGGATTRPSSNSNSSNSSGTVRRPSSNANSSSNVNSGSGSGRTGNSSGSGRSGSGTSSSSSSSRRSGSGTSGTPTRNR